MEAANESEAKSIALEMAQGELWSDDWDEMEAEVDFRYEDDDLGDDENASIGRGDGHMVTTQDVREKAKRLLDLVEKVSSYDWTVEGRFDYSITGRKGTTKLAIPFDSNDARFIAAARSDVPTLAQWVLEAIKVLEKIAYHRYDDWRLMQSWAREFLEGCGESVPEEQAMESGEK
ncbi:hypothetical protein [Alicyclobacillus sendaiensis]|uniref:hypothetical protein n=1 Tax=Alicyclobacillus sendaiensis TaxID=192387 RepID=UPI0026F479A4|nr:hypothetical protein [Alicyclobacillus sendaiensis]